MDKKQAIDELLSRRIGDFEGKPNVYPSKEEAAKKLAEAKQLRIYLGIDPTGTDLHLGHSIPLLFLKQLLPLGHRPVLVIGDFTARIGDPTGKDTTRKPLTEQEVEHNMKNYFEQIHKLLSEDSFDVKYNSSWLSKMSFEDFLRLASHVSVYQLQARSMFRERQKKGNPLALHEFIYPVMQGYDSVAMEIDGEVGGSDQMFNMLVGRDLERKLLNKEKLVFGTRLLVDERSGNKMSKTEAGFVSLSDSADDMFGKVMSISDPLIIEYFRLMTEVPISDIDIMEKELKNGTNPRDIKKRLAEEIVTLYHGKPAASQASKEWARVFSKKEKPSEIREVKLKANQMVDILVETNLVSSKSEARRVLVQGGVKVNDQVVKIWEGKITLKPGSIIQVGKRKFIKIK